MACDLIDPQTVFANKVLLEYSHNRLIYCLWLLLCSMAELSLCDRARKLF